MSLLSGCYVLGCYEETVLGVIHKRFGRVDTCIGHDPTHHNYGVMFGSASRSAVACPTIAADSSANGGLKVRPIAAPKAPRPLAPMTALQDPF